MLERVAGTIEHFGMLPAGCQAGVAVSGGADSVALLRILVELSARLSIKLQVLHFNHRLRNGESDADEAFVRTLVGDLGLPFTAGGADVGRIARETSDNLEQVARRERYRFFRRFLEDQTLGRIALGHTRSDQAETVLFRLLRGTGSLGLAAIRPVTREGFVRPLIAVSRVDVEAWLRERGAAWRDDSSNKDPRYDRNRIRHQLLPLLARDWNPSIEESLARMAAVAGDEELYWDGEIERLVTELVTKRESDSIIRADSLRTLPRAAGRRLVRRLIELAKGDLRGLDAAHVERILTLAGSVRGDGSVEVPGVTAMRSFGQIRFTRPEDAGGAAGYRFQLKPPARQRIPGSGATLYLEIRSGTTNSGYNKLGRNELDWKRIQGALELRGWEPGDRFQPFGCSRPKKLKQLFQEQRIPSWERPRWPVLVMDGQIIWARTFGIAADFAVQPGSHEVLGVWESEEGPS